MKATTLASLTLTMVLLAFPAAGPLAQEGDAPAYLEIREVPKGTVQTLTYQSESLEREREAVVYLPPGYDGSSDRYPVLYLLHGAGSDQRTWIDRGQANVILDNLIAEQRLEPLVVVMPFGYAAPRDPDAGPRRGPDAYKSDMEDFARDFMNDIVPVVESRYRVIADREHRAIAGLSMGGGQAFAIGLSNTDVFSRVAGFSSAMQIANDPAWGGLDFDEVLADAAELNESLELLWIGCGTEDTLFNANRAFSAQLTERGVEHTFRVTLGGHTMDVWQRYLYEVAPQLFSLD